MLCVLILSTGFGGWGVLAGLVGREEGEEGREAAPCPGASMRPWGRGHTGLQVVGSHGGSGPFHGTAWAAVRTGRKQEAPRGATSILPLQNFTVAGFLPLAIGQGVAMLLFSFTVFKKKKIKMIFIKREKTSFLICSSISIFSCTFIDFYV